MNAGLTKDNIKISAPGLGSFQCFFEASDTPYIVLLPNAPLYTIVAANNAYINAFGLNRDEITGKGLFTILLHAARSYILQDIKTLRASLQHVIDKKETHNLPLQYSDMAEGKGNGALIHYWKPSNIPLIENGELQYIVHSMADVTDATLQQQSKNGTDERFRNLIEQAHVAIGMYTGREMNVQLANEAMLQLWGKDSKVIGKPLRMALPELEGQPFHGLLDKVYTTGESYYATEDRADLVINGRLQTFYFNFTYKALRNDNGEIYGILNMAVDVTEQVLNRRKIELGQERYRALSTELEERIIERTRELENANANMARSNEELEQFAYVASHDLQEPLRKIRAFGDILQSRYKEQLTDEGANLINRMQAATDRMKALIEDLLTYSRVSSSNRPHTEMDTETIIRDVISDLYAAIHERKVLIHIQGMEPIGGDAMQLRQLFQNLLSNAIKFSSPERRPEIHITGKKVKGNESGFSQRLSRKELYKDYLLVELRDNGIGFEQQYADRIFQMFQRLHGNATHPGSGIGLSIVKKVIDNHNGHIKAISTPGSGATFSILLPL